MKILKPGRTPESKVPWRGTCGDCECQVECSKSETTDLTEPMGPPWHEVKCPNCGGQIRVKPVVLARIKPPQGGSGTVKRVSDRPPGPVT